MPPAARGRRGRDDSENYNPNAQQPSSASASASSRPSSSSLPSAAAAADQPAKRRRRSATAPRTPTKEELADCIARDEFWQHCEAADGEGDGYELGRGEGNGGEPIYDDCDEVRRRINAFLRSGRMTQTAWLRLIGSNSNSYGRFMKLRGPNASSMSGVYTGAARFFESLRILEHRPKSAKRLKEEAAFGRYGRTTASLRRLRMRHTDMVTWDEVRRPHVVHAGEQPHIELAHGLILGHRRDDPCPSSTH